MERDCDHYNDSVKLDQKRSSPANPFETHHIMKTFDKEIIFVYNANSDLFSTLSDFAHKLFFPSTYPCSLCQLTYGNISIKERWATYLDSLPYTKTFLHKDEASEIEATFMDELPVILIKTQEQEVETLMNTRELNQSPTLDDLIDTLGKRLETYNIP